jgi:hypothetical protein
MYFYLMPGESGGVPPEVESFEKETQVDPNSEDSLDDIRAELNKDETLDDIRADLNSDEDLVEGGQKPEDFQKSLPELEGEATDLLSSLPDNLDQITTEEEIDAALLGENPSQEKKEGLERQKTRMEQVAGKSWDFIVRSAHDSNFKTALDNIFGSSYDSSGSGAGGMSLEGGRNSGTEEENLKGLKAKLEGGNLGTMNAIFYAYEYAKINKNNDEFKKAETDEEKFNAIKSDFLEKIKLLSDYQWKGIQEGLSYYLSGTGDTSRKFNKEDVKILFENIEFKKSAQEPKKEPEVEKPAP